MTEAENIKLSTQQEIQQSLFYLEYLKEQISNLTEQFEILELAIKEHNQAIETLRDFKNLKKNDETLVPIGADSLIFAKIADSSKVIINVGAGIAVEEKLDSAIEKLLSRIENIDENKNKIKNTIVSLQEQEMMLNSAIEEKYQSLQGAVNQESNMGPPNVS